MEAEHVMSISHVIALVLEVLLGAYAAFAAYSLFARTPPAAVKIREALHYPGWYWSLAGVMATIGAIGLFAGLGISLAAAFAALWMIAYFVVAIATHLIRADFAGLVAPLISLVFYIALAALLGSDVTTLLTRAGL